MQLEYCDVVFCHRHDPETGMEVSMRARSARLAAAPGQKLTLPCCRRYADLGLGPSATLQLLWAQSCWICWDTLTCDSPCSCWAHAHVCVDTQIVRGMNHVIERVRTQLACGSLQT